MKRREFIIAVGGAAMDWPIDARAQKRAALIGWLGSGSAQSSGIFVESLKQGLLDADLHEGRDYQLDLRAIGKSERLAGLAAELITAKVDVILASGSEATRAAQRETKTVPIVMTSTNPVALGFVASLARPGGNITGLSLLGPEASGKRLEILKELIPGIAKVAVFWTPTDPGAAFSLKETQAAGEKLAIGLQILETRDVDAFDTAFLTATNEGAEAVVLLPAPLMTRNAGRIADLALKSRLPTMYYSGDAVKAGALLSYGPSLIAIYRRAAYFIDRVLKGDSPRDLPVEQPTKFDLVINLKTAKVLGVVIPPTLLLRADEVIE